MPVNPFAIGRRGQREVCVSLGIAMVLILRTAPGGAAAATIGSDVRRLASGTYSDLEPPEAITRTAGWPFFGSPRRAAIDNSQYPATPHPAVARIIAPEEGATAYGSGTLVDVREQFGLVVTNWHVVHDATSAVEVVFPNGFRSHARPLKVDQDWDLAALVIWRPAIEPVALAAVPPRPGDWLTIHGYGQGQYRVATGRCTQFYAPHANYPLEMVELDVEARQGDSGGPIFNQRGELAGVLFGAGQGTTLGSFGPRVGSFLATLAPDIGQARDQADVAIADRPAPQVHAKSAESVRTAQREWPSSPWTPSTSQQRTAPSGGNGWTPASDKDSTTTALGNFNKRGWYESAKSLFALIGVAAIVLRIVKIIR